MSRKHSRFAPSSLHRVLECPRSVALAEAAVQADPARARSSSYAAEGTVAHEIAAEYLERLTCGPDRENETIAAETVVVCDGFDIFVTQEMVDHAMAYARYVRGLMQPDSELIIEEVVDLDEVVGRSADMYGHLDAATWSLKSSTIHVIDYKYGAGIRVSPVENPQLMTYALGALYRLPRRERHQIHNVVVHVYQPRVSDGVVAWEIAAVDLLMWGASVLAPAIGMIVGGDELPPLKTGEHCRFCPAIVNCPAWAEKADAEARVAFAKPYELPGADLARALERVRALAPWIEAVEADAKHRLTDPNTGEDPVPGFKAVVSQWRRSWSNGADPQNIASSLGLALSDVMAIPVIRTPADVEKKLPKSDRNKLDPLVERRPHGVSVVTADDPRSPIDRAIPSTD